MTSKILPLENMKKEIHTRQEIKQLKQRFRQLERGSLILTCQQRKKRRGIVLASWSSHANKERKGEALCLLLKIFRQLNITMPFSEALELMPVYSMFMKDLLTEKRSIRDEGVVTREVGCNAIFRKTLPNKQERKPLS